MTAVGPYQQSPQARFQVVEQPAALPASCMFCNGSRGGDRIWFVDTGLQIEAWGAGYICNICLKEIGNTVGWLDPDQHASLLQEKLRLEQDNFHLLTQLAALHEMEKAVNAFAASRSIGRHPSGRAFAPAASLSLLRSDDEVGEATDPGAGGSPENPGPLGSGEGTAVESGDGQGVDDLRSDDDSYEFRLDI